MKTIEEKAMEYSQSSYPGQKDIQFQCEMHFEAGAEWMRTELTRWNDPKEALPSDNRWVLARVNCEVAPYRIARYFEEEKHVRAYWYVLNNPEASAGFVLAWREIHQ